jgi:CheY-like chemotaxis protein
VCPAEDEAPSFSEVERLAGIHVLVVEDDADSLELMKLILNGWGCTVSSAANVQEAFTVVELWQPDIILSDVGLPLEDGYTFMRRLRRLERSRGGRIPAVAVTAFSSESDRQMATTAGFDEHVSKPVYFSVLLRAITKALDRLS